MSAGISLYFLTGVNAGAEAQLTTGTYTVGNTPDSDLWVEDHDAPCCVQISIDEQGKVTLKVVAGQPLYNHVPLALENAEFAHLGVLSINQTHLVWTNIGEALDPSLVKELLNPSTALKTSQAPQNPDDLPFGAATSGMPSEMPRANLGANPSDMPNDAPNASFAGMFGGAPNGSPNGMPSWGQENSLASGDYACQNGTYVDNASDKKQKPKKPPLTPEQRQVLLLKLICGLCILGCLLCLLILGTTWFKQEDKIALSLQQAEEYLQQHGYDKVSVQSDGQSLHFSGVLPDRDSYTDFIQNLPNTELSTVLELNIAEHVTDAIERAFALHGMLVKAQFGSEPNSIEVYGYVYDSVEAQLILDKVKPYVGQLKLIPKFTYRQQLGEELSKLKKQYPVPLNFVYDKYQLLYSGRLALEQTANFKQIKGGLEAAINAPLLMKNTDKLPRNTIITLSNQDETILNASATPLKTAQEPKQSSNSSPLSSNALKDFESDQIFDPSQVIGVTMNPMRFLILKNGAKYFEGSTLQNGYILKQISLDKLVFEKNGQKTTVKLN